MRLYHNGENFVTLTSTVLTNPPVGQTDVQTARANAKHAIWCRAKRN